MPIPIFSRDKNGNISSIQNPDGSYVTYTYDSLNQLVSEHYSTTVGDGSPVPHNAITYEYDTRGNILSKTYSLNGETVDTVTYTYTDTVWADRLTAFDGVAISYDEIGNPLNWHDGASLSWQHGRQLASYTLGDAAISYIYNADGIRTSKTVNGVTTSYNVIDGTLRRMSDGTNILEFINGTSVLFNGIEYWYVFNAQNDVIGLIDENGEYVVKYTYDAWGDPISKEGTLADTLGTLNPFRYRGYIYDEETGFYYCNSRYYDPVVGRWLNADGIIAANFDALSFNIFAYCSNNPVSSVDPTGECLIPGILYFGYKHIGVSVLMLLQSIYGDRQRQFYDSDSIVSKALLGSNIMNDEIRDNIEKFENSGKEGGVYTGTVSLYGKDNCYDFDLSFSVGMADYSMTITEEVRTLNIFSYKVTQERFVIHVTVSDEYNFDDYREDGSLGSHLNNWGLDMQKQGVIKPYKWDATYTCYTAWR